MRLIRERHSRESVLCKQCFSEREMNKIVRDHYPVEKLPEDLRAGLSLDGHVTVTIVSNDDVQANLMLEAMDAPDRPQRPKDEIDRLMKLIRND